MVPLRTALILDVNSVYASVKAKYGNRRLQIIEYTKWIESQEHLLAHRIAFSRQEPNDVKRFLTMLRQNGFECHFENRPWGVAMAFRLADIINNVESVIVGSTEPEMYRFLKWARDRGKTTKCLAVNIPTYFQEVAQCIEIPETLLADTQVTKQLELPADSGSNGA